MKAKNAKSAAIIALMSLIQMPNAFAESVSFTPLENLPPEQRQEITEKLTELSKGIDINWDEVTVGVNEHGQITFREAMRPMGTFSCLATQKVEPTNK